MADDSVTEELITYYLWLTISPTLIIFGTVGNFLSIAVMCRRKLRSSNASVYLIALSLADTCVLYTGLLRHFLREVAGVDLRFISKVGWKIQIWLVHAFLYISAWILVAFTLERMLSVYTPYKVKIYCTRMSSVLIIIGIVVTMLAFSGINAYVLEENVIYRINESHVILSNYSSAFYEDFNTRIFPWIDFSVSSLIPFIILVTGNSCIAVKVLQNNRNIRRLVAQVVTPNYNETNVAARSINQRGVSNTPPRTDKISSMNIVLLILNLVFLVTTTPVSVFIIVQSKRLAQISTYKELVSLDLWYAVVDLIMYVNSSVNFILYCFTGSRFRKELHSMFINSRFWCWLQHLKTCQDTESVRSPIKAVPALNSETSSLPSTAAVLPGQNTSHRASLALS